MNRLAELSAAEIEADDARVRSAPSPNVLPPA